MQKKIKGKKRHILVDTLGLLLYGIVHPADIQDRDGGVLLLSTLFGLFPFLKKLLLADGGYQGPQFEQAWVAEILPELQVEIVKRSDQAKGFKILRNDGSSNEPSLGLDAVAGSPKTSRT